MKDAVVIQTKLAFVEIAKLKMLWKDDLYPLGVSARLLPVTVDGGVTVEAFVPKSVYGGVAAIKRLGYLTQVQFDEAASRGAQ